MEGAIFGEVGVMLGGRFRVWRSWRDVGGSFFRGRGNICEDWSDVNWTVFFAASAVLVT